MNRKRKIVAVLAIVGILVILGGRANADFIFGEPVNLGPGINSAFADASNCTSADHLELYFCSNRPGGLGDMDIWVSTRQSIDEPWEPPVNLGSPVNSTYVEAYPSLSSDGLTLYFSDLYSGMPRPGGLGGADIWMATRLSRNDPWTAPVNLGAPINSSAMDISPTISGDGLILVFASSRAGTSGPYDLWMSTRATVQDPWGTPINLGVNVNSSDGELECSMSADGLALFFPSGRPGGFSNYDLWMTTRKGLEAPWSRTINLGPVVNGTSTEGSPGVSSDMRTLYFDSDRPSGFGSYDLWEAQIIPVVDLNGDGIVDSADMCIVIDHWYTDNPLCDIGPAPWGDGKVDVEDLIILSEHLFEEVNDPTLVAHWPLDESEGMYAADSVGDNDAVVVGGAVWQPDSGQVNGTLQLDGLSGCAISGAVLNPADGPFSIFAWVKGGASGQVVVSQQTMANWLALDTKGNLMTELKGPGRNSSHLWSQMVITEDTWHRIGFVWDGSHRTLYVDGVAVADDTQSSLEGSQMGLYIGVDKNYAPGTFFSGLIDDVRIYNRVVAP
jgi:hypothetical protein